MEKQPRRRDCRDELAAGSLIDGRYRSERHLASGGMAEIWAAVQVRIDRPVALKVLARRFAGDATMVGRFKEEARILGRIEHPAVVRVFDSGRTADGLLYLVMELVSGVSLRRVLEDSGPMAVDAAVSVLVQILDGLAEAHDAGIIHRDLKPANVMVVTEPDGALTAKVLDFGIARPPAEGARRRGARTEDGYFVGTPEYLSPEQGLGRAVDPRADVYSVGVLAYELLTGRRPFEDEDVCTLIQNHLTAPPPHPATFRPELARYPVLCRAVLQALEKEKRRRHPDARSFALALYGSLEVRGESSLDVRGVEEEVEDLGESWPPALEGDLLPDVDLGLLPEADPRDVELLERELFDAGEVEATKPREDEAEATKPRPAASWAARLRSGATRLRALDRRRRVLPLVAGLAALVCIVSIAGGTAMLRAGRGEPPGDASGAIWRLLATAPFGAEREGPLCRAPDLPHLEARRDLRATVAGPEALAAARRDDDRFGPARFALVLPADPPPPSKPVAAPAPARRRTGSQAQAARRTVILDPDGLIDPYAE
jgi:serine/threonine protein kinase